MSIFEDISLNFNVMTQSDEILPAGSLPEKREMAKMLGVSCPALPTKIHSLTNIRILPSCRGTGAFVVKSSKSTSLDSGSFDLLEALDKFTSDELFDARLSLGMYFAALAAERAVSEHLIQMAEEIIGMFASIDNPDQFLKHDLNFHQAIASASGNRILTTTMNLVTQIFFADGHIKITCPADLKVSAKKHHQIYRAIRSRNPEDASITMQELLIEKQKLKQFGIPAGWVLNHK